MMGGKGESEWGSDAHLPFLSRQMHALTRARRGYKISRKIAMLHLVAQRCAALYRTTSTPCPAICFVGEISVCLWYANYFEVLCVCFCDNHLLSLDFANLNW